MERMESKLVAHGELNDRISRGAKVGSGTGM